MIEKNAVAATPPKLKVNFSSLRPADTSVIQTQTQGVNLLESDANRDSGPIKVVFYDVHGNFLG